MEKNKEVVSILDLIKITSRKKGTILKVSIFIFIIILCYVFFFNKRSYEGNNLVVFSLEKNTITSVGSIQPISNELKDYLPLFFNQSIFEDVLEKYSVEKNFISECLDYKLTKGEDEDILNTVQFSLKLRDSNVHLILNEYISSVQKHINNLSIQNALSKIRTINEKQLIELKNEFVSNEKAIETLRNYLDSTSNLIDINKIKPNNSFPLTIESLFNPTYTMIEEKIISNKEQNIRNTEKTKKIDQQTKYIDSVLLVQQKDQILSENLDFFGQHFTVLKESELRVLEGNKIVQIIFLTVVLTFIAVFFIVIVELIRKGDSKIA